MQRARDLLLELLFLFQMLRLLLVELLSKNVVNYKPRLLRLAVRCNTGLLNTCIPRLSLK